MQLTILGSAGTIPAVDSPCSSYLVEAEGFRLLVDFGNGAASSLQRSHGLFDVDAVLVTHLHGDHWLELVPYMYVRNFHPERTETPVPVFGPSGMKEALGATLPAGGAELLGKAYDFREVDVRGCEIGPFSVQFALTNHPVETYAVRLGHNGRSLAYSADTGVCDALVRLAREADLFLCEASFTDGVDAPPDVHLTGRQAGEHADRAGVGRLILTHFLPWTDREKVLASAQRVFTGKTTLAETHRTVRV